MQMTQIRNNYRRDVNLNQRFPRVLPPVTRFSRVSLPIFPVPRGVAGPALTAEVFDFGFGIPIDVNTAWELLL